MFSPTRPLLPAALALLTLACGGSRAPSPVLLKVPVGDSPQRGPSDAWVTMVEFADFECPYCRQEEPVVADLEAAYGADLRVVYKHLPLPAAVHPHAQAAAVAAECAHAQGKFWELHDLLFTNAHAHAIDDLASYAQQLGGDPDALRDAIASGKYLDKIRASQAEGRGAGMKGTPTLFFDGRLLGLTDYSESFLEFTLEDEEEWLANRGWAHD